MGGSGSTPAPSPSPPFPRAIQRRTVEVHHLIAVEELTEGLLPAPWREISWRDKDRDLQYVKNFELQTEEHKIRILLTGPVGAGKSSFINSVHSVLRGRMYNQAGVGVDVQSFTTRYTTYNIRKEDRTFYPFVFSDTMGLDLTLGILVDDVIMALKGHVYDGYEFKPDRGLSEGDRYYNGAPTENDKVHVLVYVVPADPAGSMSDRVLQEIQEIRNAACDLEIPQVAIFTKVDECSPEIRGLKNVYRDKRLKEKMEKFSADSGIPLNCIFPVKNYHEENAIKDEVDTLILDALRNILNSGRNYIQFRNSAERLIHFSHERENP